MNIFFGVFFMFLPFFNFGSDLTIEDKLCHSTLNAANQKLKPYGYVLICKGVKIPNKIRGMDAHFLMEGKYTIDQARILFVSCVEEIIHEANTNEPMRQYMSEYPFTNKHFEIILGFRDEGKIDIYPPYVSSVHNINDKICYWTTNPETGQSERLYSEPYSEGLRIVRESYP